MTVGELLGMSEYIDLPVGVLAQSDDDETLIDEIVFDCDSYPCSIPENISSLTVDFFVVEDYEGELYFKIYTNGLASKLRRY